MRRAVELILIAAAVALLIGLGAGFRIVGSHYSSDARRLCEFAARNRIPHRWIDLEEDKEAETLLRELNISPQDTPVVICGWEKVLRNPTIAASPTKGLCTFDRFHGCPDSGAGFCEAASPSRSVSSGMGSCSRSRSFVGAQLHDSSPNF